MATKYVSKSQFQAKAFELLREVEATGEPIVVTHKGEPRIIVATARTLGATLVTADESIRASAPCGSASTRPGIRYAQDSHHPGAEKSRR
ncbi:MAG: type II toxin-antitoxin system prevent-host-death family antitoxin [Chloroflexota bacterium]